MQYRDPDIQAAYEQSADVKGRSKGRPLFYPPRIGDRLSWGATGGPSLKKTHSFHPAE